jgi:hypothetical protein
VAEFDAVRSGLEVVPETCQNCCIQRLQLLGSELRIFLVFIYFLITLLLGQNGSLSFVTDVHMYFVWFKTVTAMLHSNVQMHHTNRHDRNPASSFSNFTIFSDF